MYNTFLRNLVALCTSVLFLFAQDVTLTLEGSNLNYTSTADIYGFQFSHNGCVTGSSGGAAADAGFMVSTSSSVVLGFSFSGAIIPAGTGTLLELDGEITIDCLSNPISSGGGSLVLDVVFDDSGPSADYVVEVSNNVFTPAHLDIEPGETVQWVNVGGFHNVDGSTATYPNNPDSFYSGSASNDSWTYSYTFTVAGSYEYECNPHAPSMAGTITVGTVIDVCDDMDACNPGAEGDCTYAADNYDCAGNCTAGVDCAGICGGSSAVDECGICGGDGIAEGACDCDGNVADCAGVCGGSSAVDECGICNGDGTSCNDTTVEVMYDSDVDIHGFQFNVSGVTLAGVSGGASEAADFTVSSNDNGDVLGFSFSALYIPAGSGVFITLTYTGDGNPCLNNLILAGLGGLSLDGDIVDCLTISYSTPCVDADEDNICDDVDACVGTYDDCGVCEGDSSSCAGCTDADACNYDAAATIDDGSCEIEFDCFGECGGSASEDSCGICNGDGTSCENSVSLSLMVTDSGVDVYMNNTAPVVGFQFSVSGISLSGASGGSAAAAGFSVSTGPNGAIGFSMSGSTIAAGDGLLTSLSGVFNAAESCIGDFVLSVDAEGFLTQSTGDCVATGWTEPESAIDILYSSDADIYGFQFNVSGVTLTGASGGASEAADFTVSASDVAVIGFSLTGSSIPAGEGAFITLTYTGDGTPCLTDLVLSAQGGAVLDGDIVDCLTVSYSAPCDDADEDGICDDIDDCVGAYDECGICNGDGISEGACDCDGNVADCAGECGGTAMEDECGICNGDGIAEGACDCDGNVADCAGICGGSSAVDECGICNGDGIAEGACDCDGNVADCAGVCGGTAENCPDWEDCLSCYSDSASMTAIVLDALSGDQMYDENDILAAFDADGNVRGVALHLYPIPFGPYLGTGLYEIQIRSDEAGDDISFKYYDASADEVFGGGAGYTFVIDDVIGSVVTPYEISVGAVELSIDIASGWNWFSLNVEGDMGIGSVMGSLTSTDGDFIKSAGSSATYYQAMNNGFGGWYGGLDQFGVTGMYKFDSADADELVFSGAPVEPLSSPIALASGWNWLGFTPQNDGPIGDALSSATTTDGDFIKNQAASATYYQAMNDGFGGWYGGLDVMAPTEGYMLDVAEGSTLVYPNFGADAALARATTVKDMPIAVSDWEVDYHDYEFNGHITMSIDSREDSHGDYIAVFVGDECRGLAERMYFPFGDSYMYSVMVYSNETDGETFSFKYYDSVIGEIVEYAETIDFTSDMIVGDGFNTYSLSRETNDLQQPIAYGISEAYPNPFNPVTSFTYSLPEDGLVQIAIYDISGKMVSELTNGYMSAGSYPLVWNANNLSSGIYFIQMYSGDFASTQKIMLVK